MTITRTKMKPSGRTFLFAIVAATLSAVATAATVLDEG